MVASRLNVSAMIMTASPVEPTLASFSVVLMWCLLPLSIKTLTVQSFSKLWPGFFKVTELIWMSNMNLISPTAPDFFRFNILAGVSVGRTRQTVHERKPRHQRDVT